jgi:acetyl/propionyl-CoA carboxylase alpha subunit
MNEFVITINGKKFIIKVLSSGQVQVGEKIIQAEISKLSGNSYLLHYGNRVFEITSDKYATNHFGFMIDGWYYDSIVRTTLQETAESLQQNKIKAKHHSNVKAPMPGLLLKLKKRVGDEVKLGEAILILEAMKMENELRSPSSGIVKEVFFNEGQSVEKDSIILTIE